VAESSTAAAAPINCFILEIFVKVARALRSNLAWVSVFRYEVVVVWLSTQEIAIGVFVVVVVVIVVGCCDEC
jgi:hypothetical protein